MRTCISYTMMVLFLVAGTSITLGSEGNKEWSMAQRLYGDTTARKVGDLLTVIIDEKAESAKNAQSSSSKQTTMGGQASVGHPRVDAQPTAWTNAVVPAWNVNVSRAFEGSGSTGNKDSLDAKIAARVTEVLPNGTLLIEGKRSVIVQDETVEIFLTGTVRQDDITGDNTVSSSRIADATIRYASSGPVSREQKRGLFTRLWNWVNPF